MVSAFVFIPIRSEDTSEDELDDGELQNIIIVTQTPAVLRKHPGGDRTAQSYHRSKLSLDAAESINVGLYFYEQVIGGDVWRDSSVGGGPAGMGLLCEGLG